MYEAGERRAVVCWIGTVLRAVLFQRNVVESQRLSVGWNPDRVEAEVPGEEEKTSGSSGRTEVETVKVSRGLRGVG